MNRIMLLGRLTKDPELKLPEEGGKAAVRFFLAVERPFKNSSGEKVADFVPIVIWGRKAEVAAEFLKKGSLITISGRLQTRSYEDSSGVRRFFSQVVADEFQFVDMKKESPEAEIV